MDTPHYEQPHFELPDAAEPTGGYSDALDFGSDDDMNIVPGADGYPVEDGEEDYRLHFTTDELQAPVIPSLPPSIPILDQAKYGSSVEQALNRLQEAEHGVNQPGGNLPEFIIGHTLPEVSRDTPKSIILPSEMARPTDEQVAQTLDKFKFGPPSSGQQ